MSIFLDAKIKSSSEPPLKHSFSSKVKSSTNAAKPFFKIFFISFNLLKEIKIIPKHSILPAISSLSGTITILSIPSSIKVIVTQAKKTGLKGSEAFEKNLRIASATANIACGILSGIKIIDTFGTAIANLSHSMGPARVAITTLAPFTVALAGIEIVKTTIDIGIDAVHIHQTNKKIETLRNKTKLWGSIDWKDEAAVPIISNKIEHLQAKQLRSQEELSQVEGALKTSVLAVNHRALKWEAKKEKLAAKKLALNESPAMMRLFGKAVPKIKAARAKSKYKIALKEHTGTINEFTHLSDKYNKRTTKIKNWKIIEKKMKAGTITDQDQVLLKKFQEDQITKWKTKKSNYKLDRLKIGLGIALKTVVIITLVASIAFTFSGYGTVPGIVTVTTLSLFIIAAEYGLKKFKKYKKPATWSPGHVPLL